MQQSGGYGMAEGDNDYGNRSGSRNRTPSGKMIRPLFNELDSSTEIKSHVC